MAFWVFQSLVSTAALAVVVAAICRFTRIGPVARHALWVLVLIKFVTPPLVVWPWAAPDPFGLAVTVADSGPSVHRGAAGVPVAVATALPREAAEPLLNAELPPDRSDSIQLWPWVLALWAAGSLVVMGIEIVRLSRMARRIRDARPVDPLILNRAAALSAQIGLDSVPVIGVAGRDAPAVWGFGRPRLLWPAELAADASDACIDGLLLHELAHVRRRDHLVGWVELAAGVAWWWNPVFWQVRAALREQAELACDAWVISALPNGRRAYAESLLTLSGPEVRGVPPVAVMGIRAGSRRVLERRLVMIMKGRAPVRLPRVGTLALVLMAAATLPAWATSPQQTKAQPPQQQTPPEKVKVVTPDLKVLPRVVQKDGKTYNLTVKDAPPKGYVLSVKDQKSKNVDVIVEKGTARWVAVLSEMPDEGRKLVDGFQADRESIQAEADKKIAERRDAAAKSLQALQERYTKEGKLDEAVAIRDYIRAGMPGLDGKRILLNGVKK
jgi:beta-lactamase regulating signal transducer with metallopeptidase domain